MQVLLLQPWVEDFYSTDCRIQPIGLAYLAESIRHALPQMDVQIFDAQAGGKKITLPWPSEFAYLKPYYGKLDQSPYKLFHEYYRFGVSEKNIREYLKKQNPMLIGISCLFTPYYRQSLEMAKICKSIFPNAPIVMGGNHATLHPHTLLGKYCDYVLRGEAEESICLLIQALIDHTSLENIPNLLTHHLQSHDRVNKFLETPKREKIAHPSYTGLNPDHYTYNKQKMTFIVTSRSCPHHCSFCSIHAVFGNRYTMREVEDILIEIRERYRSGIRHFDIEDDNFTFQREKTMQLLKSIINEKLAISLSAMNGLSYLSLDRQLLEVMKNAGFDSLNLALVSSDSLVLKFSSRPHTVEKFCQIIRDANDLELRTTVYSILGMPGQTVQDMWQTLLFLAKTQCLIGASPFYFTPGSPIHQKECRNPHIQLASKNKDAFFSARLTAMDVETNTFNRDDIYTLFRLTRVINHIKNGIDLGKPQDDPYFDNANEILKSGKWFAQNKNGPHQLPFSPKVFSCIQNSQLEICGYKTSNKFDPMM